MSDQQKAPQEIIEHLYRGCVAVLEPVRHAGYRAIGLHVMRLRETVDNEAVRVLGGRPLTAAPNIGGFVYGYTATAVMSQALLALLTQQNPILDDHELFYDQYCHTIRRLLGSATAERFAGDPDARKAEASAGA